MAENYTLCLASAAQNASFRVTATSKGEQMRGYYTIGVTLPEGTPCGEYAYTLSALGAVLAVGMARVGEIESESKSYTRAEPKYYEFND